MAKIFIDDLIAITVTCSLPVDLPPNTTLTSYSSPALVGTTATVSCDGVNKTAIITCLEDGSWQPDVLNDISLCNIKQTVTSKYFTPSPATVHA